MSRKSTVMNAGTLRLLLTTSLAVVLMTVPRECNSQQTPTDLTVASGTDAAFNCSGVSFVEWSVFQPTISTLFDSRTPTDPMIDQTKYRIDGTYNLVVRSVNPQTSAYTYQCRNSNVAPFTANLVIIDQSTLDITMPNQLSVGQVAVITCRVSYGAPSTSAYGASTKPLTGEQDPQLSLTLDDVNFSEPTVLDTQPNATSRGYHTKTATVNHTVLASDGGKTLKCRVTSLTYSQTVQKTMTAPYAPNKVNITGVNTTVNVGDRITCRANGYPTPTVSWVPFTAGLQQPTSGAASQGTATLTVGNPEIRAQQWKCLASNTLGNYTSDIINLRVGPETGQDTSAARPAILGVEGSLLTLLLTLLGFAMMVRH